MESVNDYITNIISQDIHYDTNWGNIVSYSDFDGVINKKIFSEYLTTYFKEQISILSI